MSRLLKYRLKETDLDLPEVIGFDCGPNRWDVEVATWFKSKSGENSVLEDIRRYHIEAWAYRTEEEALVGFSSLGENTWSLPMPQGPRLLINYIPFIGVHRDFQGKPEGVERDDKYAYQILDDLIEYAVEKTARREDLTPVIGLSVDEENKKAIKFYLNRDFVDLQCPRKDKATGVVYRRMLLSIAEYVGRPLPPGL